MYDWYTLIETINRLLNYEMVDAIQYVSTLTLTGIERYSKRRRWVSDTKILASPPLLQLAVAYEI